MGALVALERMWALALAWWGGRLDPDWRPRTPEESQAILEQVGLTGSFWRLGPA